MASQDLTPLDWEIDPALGPVESIQLLDFQQRPIQRGVELFIKGNGVFIFGPTGSGKTIVSITILQRALQFIHRVVCHQLLLRQQKLPDIYDYKVLCVVPPTIVNQWVTNFQKNTMWPPDRVISYIGDKRTLVGVDFSVVVTSYHTLISELGRYEAGTCQSSTMLFNTPWCTLILDEVQRLRNAKINSKNFKYCLKSFNAIKTLNDLRRKSRSPMRLITGTATPFVNNISDLNPVLHLFNQQIKLNTKTDAEQRFMLERILQVYFVEIKRNERENDTRLYVVNLFHSYTARERAAYRAVCLDRMTNSKTGSRESRSFQKTRYCNTCQGCIHGALLRASGFHFCPSDSSKFRCFDQLMDRRVGEDLPKSLGPNRRCHNASKNMDVRTIPSLRGEKIIVFAQHARPLSYLCFHIIQRERKMGNPPPIMFLHFSAMHKKPHEIYKQFKEVKVLKNQLCLLVATRRSMSEGVDLPFALAVVFLDLMWSRAPEEQARGRIFRPAQAQAEAKNARDKFAFYLRIDPCIPTIELLMHQRQVKKNKAITRTLRDAHHHSTLTSIHADNDVLDIGPVVSTTLIENNIPEQPSQDDLETELQSIGQQEKTEECVECQQFQQWMLSKGMSLKFSDTLV